MSLASNRRVPELVTGVDVRTLPLSALDGFVLSRIDGRVTVTDIVSLTGLGVEQVASILDRLVELGAMRYRDDERASDRPSGAAPRGTHPVGPPHVGASQPPRRRVSHAAPPHRRMLSESGISSAAPEAPTHSTRPRSNSESSLPASPGAREPTGSFETDTSQRGRRPSAPRLPPVAPVSASVHASQPLDEPRQSPTRESASSTSGPPPTRPVSRVSPGGASLAPSALPAPASYDPRELDEEVDLPRERRKQILDLYYQLPVFDYYEALGIPYRAEKKQIRSAYFALSKAFHPDSMFRKNLGSFKAKMEAVFHFLTEAYETLSKKKSREEYDAYLRSTKAVRMAERALLFDAAEEAQASALRDKVPPPPLVPQNIDPAGPQSSEPPPYAPLPPPKEVSAEARKLAQEVIGRRLRGAGTMSPRPLSATKAPTGPSQSAESAGGSGFDAAPKASTHELLARLTRTLRDVGHLTGSNDMVTRAVRASQAAIERGDLSEATQQAARAASLAPERSELKSEHARLSGLLSEKLADDYVERAKFEMKQGKWASAALTWSKVCEGRPNDASAHQKAAYSLYKGGGELRSAQKYAQKAVFLAPTDIDARILLAQIYLTVGLKLNARRELDAAAKLDPANEMVKNLLADLDKG